MKSREIINGDLLLMYINDMTKVVKVLNISNGVILLQDIKNNLRRTYSLQECIRQNITFEFLNLDIGII